MNNKIAFVGSGLMAEAMINGLLRNKLYLPEEITASGPREERGEFLMQEYGISSTTSNPEAIHNASTIVFSFKPQVIQQVVDDLAGLIKEDVLLISIVAGVTIETLQKGLNHNTVVRCMPNTPAQIGDGITVWACSSSVTGHQKDQTKDILKSFGDEILVDDEDYLDMATAVSGTGPAYAFLFMEAMIDAGVHLGFPRYIAEKLVLKTLEGSVKYVLQADQHLSRLRNEVTSPGGTSAEALYYLEKAGLRTAISKAIWAAHNRSIELGKGIKLSNIED